MPGYRVSAPTVPPRAGLFLLYPPAWLTIFSMVPDKPITSVPVDGTPPAGTKLKAPPISPDRDGAFFCLIQIS